MGGCSVPNERGPMCTAKSAGREIESKMGGGRGQLGLD